MNAIIRARIALTVMSIAGIALCIRNGIAQPAPDGIDLGAIKPKTQSPAGGNVVGAPTTANQKSAIGQGNAATTAPATTGSAAKGPLGTKTGIGVVGLPGSGAAAAKAPAEEAASSTDVQIKMPSNYNRK
jgi:hypothetical protein